MVLRGVIIYMKKLWDWGNRNVKSIYTGCVVALLMMIVIFVKDIQNTNREIKRLGEMGQLLESHEKLVEDYKAAGEFIEFQQLVMDNLRNENALQERYLMRLTEMINKQSLTLKALIDYLKEIKEWPPKIDPPKPIDPDTLAGRSEA